jgi:hypothetical protein
MTSEAKSMLIIFFDIKGIVHKEFVLVGQTVNSTYYYFFFFLRKPNLFAICNNTFSKWCESVKDGL